MSYNYKNACVCPRNFKFQNLNRDVISYNYKNACVCPRDFKFQIDRAATVQERLLFKKHFLSPLFAAINRERLLFESDL